MIKNSVINISDDWPTFTNVYNSYFGYELQQGPLYIGLGHELIHGLHRLDGTTKKGKDIDPLRGWKIYRADNEDLFTIGLKGDEEFTNNKLREEHGLPKRATYGVEK